MLEQDNARAHQRMFTPESACPACTLQLNVKQTVKAWTRTIKCNQTKVGLGIKSCDDYSENSLKTL